MKKLISWNVNGLRACVGKGFMDFFNEVDADVFCIQESKLQEGQIDLDLPGYHQYWNYAEKKGYSGTAMFTKEEPISVSYGLGIEEHDHEGRVITAEFPEYYIVTCYTPNSKDGLARLDYRMTWEDAFLAYLKKLEEKKPVIFCCHDIEMLCSSISEWRQDIVIGMMELETAFFTNPFRFVISFIISAPYSIKS